MICHAASYQVCETTWLSLSNWERASAEDAASRGMELTTAGPPVPPWARFKGFELRSFLANRSAMVHGLSICVQSRLLDRLPAHYQSAGISSGTPSLSWSAVNTFWQPHTHTHAGQTAGAVPVPNGTGNYRQNSFG
jgi:hypothetical protein